MAQQDSMEELSVAQIIEKHNLIVPEIQREYVWGFNTHQIIDTFIEDIKAAYAVTTATTDESYEELQLLKKIIARKEGQVKKELEEEAQALEIKTRGEDINIGFLYSYRPNYVIDENAKDVFLIDGQQRFTTLFLFLFYFAIRENRKGEFEKVFRFNAHTEKIAFDYRVRTITHDFIIDLVQQINTLADFEELRQKNWFLATYKEDTTIKAIVGESDKHKGVFPLLQHHFAKDQSPYFDFILNKIKFWHFKTNETSQGQELYITMNSRGQQLEDNETIRARLFATEEAQPNKMHWSEQWEKWQDFFWKNRNKSLPNSSADKGFNEFLRWVVILDQILQGEVLEEQHKLTRLGKIVRNQFDKLPIETLQLTSIEATMEALQWLLEKTMEFKEQLQSNYPNWDNFDVCDLHKFSTRELPYKQIELFQLLPVLHYIRLRKSKQQEINPQHLFRLMRFFANRAQDRSLGKSIDNVLIAGVKMIELMDDAGDLTSLLDHQERISKTLLNEEELLKLTRYRDSAEREQLEALYWTAEDYGANKGSIIHHIRFTEKVAEQENMEDNASLFETLFTSYRELYEAEEAIWGDLLPSNMYTVEGDRIWCAMNWHKNTGFMDMVCERYQDSAIPLTKFLEKRQKDFLLSYDSGDAIRAEEQHKKQLYLYYILTQFLGKKWVWDKKWNFGIYSHHEKHTSLFHTDYIYERYNAQWRYNVGYQTQHGLWIQENQEEDRDYLQEILDWANDY